MWDQTPEKKLAYETKLVQSMRELEDEHRERWYTTESVRNNWQQQNDTVELCSLFSDILQLTSPRAHSKRRRSACL